MNNNVENEEKIGNEDCFEKEDKNKYFGRRVAITGGIILGDLLLLQKLAGTEITDLFFLICLIVGSIIFYILAHYLDYLRKKGNKIVVPVVNILLLLSYILLIVLTFLL
ncbi:MAG: hypothetical protein J6X11_07220 [Treponema sp.]|nr:hypothetical protein [Treponema sp.]MBP5748932.1 hypothetical protein [Treponema sp.]